MDFSPKWIRQSKEEREEVSLSLFHGLGMAGTLSFKGTQWMCGCQMLGMPEMGFKPRCPECQLSTNFVVIHPPKNPRTFLIHPVFRTLCLP